MKNNKLYFTILFSLMGLQTPIAMAQPEVNYPNPGYWYWESPCDDHFCLSGEEHAYISPREYYPNDDSPTCIVNPFNATDQNRTIYGAALCLFPVDHDWWAERMTPVDRRVTLDIIVYTFTPGDSVVHPIISQTFIVEQGQPHDLVMSYPGGDLHPMYEFYFDTPIEVDGPIYMGVRTTDTVLIEYAALYNIGRQVLWQNDGACCLWGYDGYVDIKRQVLLSYYTTPICPDERVAVFDRDYLFRAVVAPSTDTLHTFHTQYIMPIIKPKGYLTAARLRDAGDVQLKPNPARTRVTVEADQAIRYVELTDMAGRTMIVQKYDGGTRSATLDINALPLGLYMVKVRTDRAVATRKLLVE